MSLYVLIFIGTLAPAVIVGLRRGGDDSIVAAILLASFLGSHIAWGSDRPVMANAVSDLICAAAIVLLCSERWAMRIGVLFVAAVACSLSQEMRGMVAYAHILSIIGHAQNIGTIIGGRTHGRYDRKLRIVGDHI